MPYEALIKLFEMINSSLDKKIWEVESSSTIFPYISNISIINFSPKVYPVATLSI